MPKQEFSKQDVIQTLSDILSKHKLSLYLAKLEESLSGQFVWAVKSDFDDSGADASFYTINDLTLYYNDKTSIYYLDVDTLVLFDSNAAKIKHLERLLNEFTKYMTEHNYSTNEDYEWLGSGLTIQLQSTSIEQLYM